MLTFSDEGLELTETNVQFALDSEVKQKRRDWFVHRKDLVSVANYYKVYGPQLAEGPTWIHPTIVPFKDGGYLVTLAWSRNTGAPRPDIALAADFDGLVTVLEE